jgi:hypothetical protein
MDVVTKEISEGLLWELIYVYDRVLIATTMNLMLCHWWMQKTDVYGENE